MATKTEMQVEQKRLLYKLLKLKKDNAKVNVIGLNELINQAEAEMDEEDVAWVEKKIAQL
ncbi:MAG: hypothetical protein FWB96_13470 [Defluviitaleaceae bacterium]|nr:hypothetical protein [Defluviitaleaceae bacterium]MCL2264332.1 hypothetical protein [Defluviitaleaceae bacterium]